MGLRTQFFKALGFEPIRRPRRRLYDGATTGRLLSDWIANGTSADAEINGSLSRLRNRARQLVRDSDYAKQAKRAVVNNVIGTGVKLQGRVMMQRGGKLDESINDQIERAWSYWGYKSYCDVSGRLCFADIERMVVGAMCESGGTTLHQSLEATPVKLIWVTDGKGWGTTARPLRDAFDKVDFVLNLSLIDAGCLEEAITIR